MESRLRRRIFVLGGLLLGGLLLVNLLAYVQAGKMMRFAMEGAATKAPEELAGFEKWWVLVSGVSIPRPATRGTPADLGLVFETHTLTTGEGIDLEMWHVPLEGARVLVLLFHGYAGCKSDLLPVAAALRDLGHAVLLVDFRGCGGSSGDETTLGWREAWDVSASVAFARERFADQKIALYGVSMGGAACTRAIAEEGVKVDALVLESVFDSLLNTVRNRFHLMGLPGFPGAELLVHWGGVRAGHDGFENAPVAFATEVQCPTLVMRGALDKRVRSEQARAVFDSLRGPKTFRSYSGVGHQLIAVERPEEWRRDVGALLAAL